MQKYEGYVSLTKDVDAYVRVPDLDHETIFVRRDYLNTAMQGDRVFVELSGKDEAGMYGKILDVIVRSKKTHVGTLEKIDKNSHGFEYLLLPTDNKTYVNIFVEKNIKSFLCPDGTECVIDSILNHKVAVEITEWIDETNARAKIIKDLGMPGENNTEMLAYAIERGFSDQHFPKSKEEAELISKKGITEEDKKGRRDFRDILTFTIDPYDAKDFDDAISYKVLDNGHMEVGIHIADVSYYVRPGTGLDEEAIERETSVYLVDRCIPMLPEELSNDLCSLVEGKDRLVMSAVFELDMSGKIFNEWYGRCVINSAKRFTYENAQESMDNNGPHSEVLNTLNALAKNMYAERLKAGALVLESEEVKFKLDDNGKPVDVYVKERGDTHKMIEELMLLANRKVSEYITNHQTARPPICVYRVHDKPDPERMLDLSLFIKGLGENVKYIDGTIDTKELNNLLVKMEGRPEKDLLQSHITRAMAKAIYSLDNIGHYGLAFEYYSHFTSPIRRYPDVLTHRILQDILDKNYPKEEDRANLKYLCIRASDREKDAADAERGSIKYKQVEYMSDRIGKTFEGVISGVSKWGIYVEEKKSKSEGMIRLRDLGSDFYNYDEKTNTIVGERSSEVFKIGDRLKIMVRSTSLEERQIDYVIVR